MKTTASRIQRPVLPLTHAFDDPVSDRGDRLLGDLRAVHLSQMRADLPVGQPFRRQGNHHVIHPGQPPLPFSDHSRLETGITVPRHGDLHRPGLGDHRLRPVAVTGIPAITARRIVPAIAKVIVHLAFQGALDHHLRQLPQKPALAGQPQPARPSPLGQLPQRLLIGRRQLHGLLAIVSRHVSHWCLLHLGGYTVEITVPLRGRLARSTGLEGRIWSTTTASRNAFHKTTWTYSPVRGDRPAPFPPPLVTVEPRDARPADGLEPQLADMRPDM